jgi:predicted GIY-YIG superfamily endonuclease
MGHIYLFRPESRTITKLFRNTNVKIAFKTNDTIQHHPWPNKKIEDIYNLSGVYQMKCEEYPHLYVGQTGSRVKDRFREHIRDIKTGNSSSRYAQHMNNTGHCYSSINQCMGILHIETKGQACQSQSQSYFTTVGLPPISSFWRQAPWDPRPDIYFNWTPA